MLADRPSPPTFVQLRPSQDPRIEDDVSWVNHITIEWDREFMRNFSDQTRYGFGGVPGYRTHLVALGDPAADLIRPGTF